LIRTEAHRLDSQEVEVLNVALVAITSTAPSLQLDQHAAVIAPERAVEAAKLRR
jgi:hypothetical protein